MAAPIITIKSISKTKISDEAEHDQCIVTFSANQNIKSWVARAGGLSPDTGLIVGQAITQTLYPSETLYPGITLYPIDISLINAGTEIQFEIDDEELTGGDGAYRINIYGQNDAEEWTAYGG